MQVCLAEIYASRRTRLNTNVTCLISFFIFCSFTYCILFISSIIIITHRGYAIIVSASCSELILSSIPTATSRHCLSIIQLAIPKIVKNAFNIFNILCAHSVTLHSTPKESFIVPQCEFAPVVRQTIIIPKSIPSQFVIFDCLPRTSHLQLHSIEIFFMDPFCFHK